MNKNLHSKFPAVKGGDLVLQEVWRNRDELSASYGHDVGKLFAAMRRQQKASGKKCVSGVHKKLKNGKP